MSSVNTCMNVGPPGIFFVHNIKKIHNLEANLKSIAVRIKICRMDKILIPTY